MAAITSSVSSIVVGDISSDRSVTKVVVVGSGAAGLSSAYEAARAGASVLLLEKAPSFGGNSAKASSGINGAETEVQESLNILDSMSVFREDTLRVGQHINNPLLVTKLSADSHEAIHFLKNEMELPLTDLIQLGGHTNARTHRLATHAPIGFSMVKAIKAKVDALSNVRVESSSEVLGILFDEVGSDRIVRGVSYRDANSTIVEYSADAVILATGGMGYDQSDGGLLSEFAPHVRGLATSSGPWANGEGMVLARAIGAALVDMDKVQLHPTGLLDPKDPSSISKILGPESLRGCGAILINKAGQRFVNELDRRGAVTQHIFDFGDSHPSALASGRDQKVALMLLNQEVVDKFSPQTFKFYVSRGIFREHASVDAMCEVEGVDVSALKDTISSYNRQPEGVADATGKTHFPMQSFDPSASVWAAHITPVIHYTMGGIRIDENAAVQSAPESGITLRNLFAAGECTGGVHGGDRLAGNSLLDCVVYGRTAGRSAVAAAAAASVTDAEALKSEL